jgi:hypothetical protein
VVLSLVMIRKCLLVFLSVLILLVGVLFALSTTGRNHVNGVTFSSSEYLSSTEYRKIDQKLLSVVGEEDPKAVLKFLSEED